MKISHALLLLSGALLLTNCSQTTSTASSATASNESEWEVLFDGSSFDKWQRYNGGEISDAWTIEDGAMVFNPQPSTRGLDLVTKENFHSFELELEWKLAEGGNSGIFFGVVEDERLSVPYLTGPEIQVLDNLRHPDAKAGETHQAGALYDMVAPSSDVTKPAGEWNSYSILIDHHANQGHVILNGEKVVEFPLHGPAWEEMVAQSKFANWDLFGKYRTGKIGLQDHGDQVAFRNIRVRRIPKPELTEEPTDPRATELYEPFVPKANPAAGQGAPSDAIVLFDGSSLEGWESVDGEAAAWTLNEDGSMTVADKTGDIRTKESFGSMQLHIEWRSPAEVMGSNQSRANSGIFLQELYEIQVLDNNQNPTYVNGQVGSIYKQHVPLAMASTPSGEWNSFDAVYHAPQFDESGAKTKSGTLTLFHNGVLIHDHIEIKGTTPYTGWPKNEPHGEAPLRLQDHRDNSRVSYRNIWVRRLND